VRQKGYGVLGLVLLMMGLVACGPARVSTVPERAFLYRVTDGTAELRWDCTRTAAGEVRIEGMVSNPFFPQPIKDFRVQVYGVGANEASVLRASATARDVLIQTNARSPFEVTFQPAGSEARYDFVYVYRIEESKHTDRSGGQRNLARNVCPDLQR
jgi:hypothetical protein